MGTRTRRAIADVQRDLRDSFALKPWAKAHPKSGLEFGVEILATKLAQRALARHDLDQFGPSGQLVINAALDAAQTLPESI